VLARARPSFHHAKENTMLHISPVRLRAWRETVALAALLTMMSALANAQDADVKSSATTGRIEFDYADAPPANVELDLSQGMFNDLFGIGDAAVAGVAEALAQSAGTKPGADGTRFAAEQLKAAREIVQTAQQVVHGVRIRAYKNEGDQSAQIAKMLAHYNDKVHTDNWETIVRAHEEGNSVTVSAIRSAAGIKGIFVAATDGENAVLVNVVCDISPDNVKKLTTSAVNIGLRAGLSQDLEKKFGKFHSQATLQPAEPKQNP
jgi:hypothetical protein